MVKSLSIIPRDMLSIQGRETGLGTNHGSPQTNREYGSALSCRCIGSNVCFSFPPDKLLIQFMRWKTVFAFYFNNKRIISFDSRQID